jgi:hypothetical protein
MLINISNLDTEYEDRQFVLSYVDAWTLDRGMCIILSRLLYELANYVSDYPRGYTCLEDWTNDITTHAHSLHEYGNIIHCNDDVEETHILQDAKSAFAFVSEYLEELWANNESDI